MTVLRFPSGLVGEVRKIKGTEIAAIAEQADGGGSSDGGFNAILGGCWQQTLDAGPYAFVRTGDSNPDWNRLLKGDLLFGVIGLRQISITDGDDYEFDVHCEECRARIPWTVKLSDLPVKQLSPAAMDRVRSGAPFETSIAGKKVLFSLQTVAQEEPIVRLMKQTKRTAGTIVDVLAGQTVSIEGVNPDIKARWRWLAELSMGELYDLRAAMEEPDCGLHTNIEVRCVNRTCQWEQEVNLPLGKRFFAPKKRKATAESVEARADSSGTSSTGSPVNGSGSGVLTSGGTSTAEVAIR